MLKAEAATVPLVDDDLPDVRAGEASDWGSGCASTSLAARGRRAHGTCEHARDERFILSTL
jgi:hypothetical protein